MSQAATTRELKAIADEVVSLSEGPDFIKAEAARVADAVQSVRTARTLVFTVMTDMHLFDGNINHVASLTSAQYAGKGVAGLKKRMHVDFVGYLGDYTWGAADHTVEQIKRDITAFKETTDTTGDEIWCVGNHDLNYGKNRDRLMTPNEVYSYICANADGVKPYAEIERGYGYLDFDQQKVRVIYLNTCDAGDWSSTAGTAARAEWVSPTQMQWLADTALDFSGKERVEEWGVVILGHHPLHYGFACYDNVMKILEAYRGGLSGSLSCQQNAETYKTVTYDFRAGDRAEIICNIHGHNHNCGFSKISSSTRTGSTAVKPWLWRLCIPNISANRYNSGYDSFVGNETALANYGEVDANGDPVYWTKEAGTAKATSFCVISVDRENKKVFAHIFGAGVDRVVSYAPIPLKNFTIARTLTNCTSSSAATSITEESSHTETLTAASGYTLDGATVKVTMGGVDITASAYSNGVLTIGSVAGDIVITATAVVVPKYTNQIPISTAKTGGIYDGDGWRKDYRLNSSGDDTGGSGYGVTGYIPIPAVSGNAEGQVVLRLANMEMGTTDANTRIAAYNADKTFTKLYRVMDGTNGYQAYKLNYWLGDNGYVNRVDLSAIISMNMTNDGRPASDFSYIRLCAPGLDGESILTVNEEIE